MLGVPWRLSPPSSPSGAQCLRGLLSLEAPKWPLAVLKILQNLDKKKKKKRMFSLLDKMEAFTCKIKPVALLGHKAFIVMLS